MLKKQNTPITNIVGTIGCVSSRTLSQLALVALVCIALFAAGCAKHPSPTAPVGGYGKASGHAITKTALSVIGSPYKLGGNSPSKGFDCSGLVLWTYQQYGINLPRTAREQMLAGKAIRKEQLRPGDLVVFKISGRRGYHSGIYTGNGKFVHSPRSGQTVREDQMESTYWKKRFISARRLTQVIQ